MIADRKSSWSLLQGFCTSTLFEDMVIQAIIWRSRGTQAVRFSSSIGTPDGVQVKTYNRYNYF